MMTMNANVRPYPSQTTYRMATCWKITRRDGFYFCGTNHNHAITYDGDTFEPTNSLDVSSLSQKDDLGVVQREFMAVLDDDRITHQDLADQLYQQARVEEYLFDWKYPFMGRVTSSCYWISDVKFSDNTWEVSMEGLTRGLKSAIGRTYTRNERMANTADDYEDARGPLSNWTSVAMLVTAITGTHSFGGVTKDLDGYNRFTVAALGAIANGYYTNGKLLCLSGSNAGREYDVKLHDTTGIELFIESQGPFVVNDTIAIIAGYDGTFEQARVKFSNAEGFRGFPYIPGPDSLLRIPDAR